MNILRPLSTHLPIYKPQLTSTCLLKKCIPFLLLVSIVLFFYLLCLKMVFLAYFISVLSKVGLHLWGGALYLSF
jgi:succinate dehydrogenase (ubiquinone) cytochrome b560 subunit|uniref:Succinate dehydrogenase subunit 3 n=2 Tax=Bruguiera TaxID=39983 RepID=A0A7T3UT46_9ROSI|nr:succinate dehydrogenase subunit 3 [Bruguiera sexangula]YP_010131471.1 succinate dehydrogenase subunit 3 [Bruguiera x rhynchopetala]YP_010585287.1 succinate dehydrogenase subunit 3 [Kandelia obovata]QPZ76250.1 succinate dehydrogenase subunit 3 [Bruguiera sexangula]QPZ76299.1 succinate dehydrogenase subunit 3 [Bruguiera x rhynchopetala]UZU71445.1 succinate dehydrogenase subunit 3 [Kandelia obovata]